MSDVTFYGHLRTFLEVPILNPRYWAKVPQVTVDAIMMDLEDSVPAASKSIARDRVSQALSEPAFFGGRQMVVRVNSLATEWGSDDLAMLGDHDGDVIVCYPKAQSSGEITDVVMQVRRGRLDRGVWAMIETPLGVLNAPAVAQTEGVVGLHFGYTDYAAEMGIPPFDAMGDGLSVACAHAARQIAIAAAGNGCFATGGSMIPDFRDDGKVACFLREWVDMGYTGCLALSPSHVPLIEQIFIPSGEEKEAARALCALFEAATASGAANAQVDGRIITLPDYRRALKLLSRCRPG